MISYYLLLRSSVMINRRYRRLLVLALSLCGGTVAWGASWVFSSYLGGSHIDASGTDFSMRGGVAVDQHGNLYVVGGTRSDDFPVTNAYQSTHRWSSRYDAFLSKISPSGTLIFSTYFGGTFNDLAHDVAVDRDGNIYIVGETESTDIGATGNAYQGVKGAVMDGFIAKFGPSGTNLLYCSYLGGIGNDYIMAIALDSQTNIYVAGHGGSTNFPTTAGAYQMTRSGGNRDVFVTKLNPAGNGLVYSTFVGASSDTNLGYGDMAYDLAVDSSGAAVVCGRTDGIDFPSVQAVQGTFGGGTVGGVHDAYIFRLAPDGASLEFSTYLGGTSDDQAYGVTIDDNDAVIVVGQTLSTNFPLHNAWQTNRYNAATYPDAFICKYFPEGTGVVFSTRLGGGYSDIAYATCLGPSNTIYVTGRAGGNGSAGMSAFPLLSAIQTNIGSLELQSFVTRLSEDGQLMMSTYHGGGSTDQGMAIAMGPGGTPYVAGHTYSASGFPLVNPFQSTIGGGSSDDAFVFRMPRLPVEGAPIRVAVAMDTQFVMSVETDLGVTYDAETSINLFSGWGTDPAFTNRPGTGGLMEYTAPLDQPFRYIRIVGR